MIHTEQLSRRFIPSGQDQPPKMRRYEVGGDYERAFVAFGRWLESHEYEYHSEYDESVEKNRYEQAAELIQGIRLSVLDINSLVVLYQEHKNIGEIGILLSTLYNKSPDEIIVWDFTLPISKLGYKLQEDKIFINRGKTGDDLGEFASGIAINLGETAAFMGYHASSIVINYGEAGHCMGMGIKGIVIAIRNPESFSDELYNAKLILKQEDCTRMPELAEYFDNLKRIFESGRDGDYQALLRAVDEFGPNPRQRIEQDIKSILRSSGYEV